MKVGTRRVGSICEYMVSVNESVFNLHCACPPTPPCPRLHVICAQSAVCMCVCACALLFAYVNIAIRTDVGTEKAASDVLFTRHVTLSRG